MRVDRMIVALFAASVLAACGGGATGGKATALPATSGAGKSAQAKIRILVPTAGGTTSAARRKALSVAYNTNGVTVAVYTSPRSTNPTAIATASFDVSAASANCVAGSSPRTCAYAVALPGTGTDDFVVTTYDTAPTGGAIPGSANQLGIGVDPSVAISYGSNAVNLTIDGVVASVALLPTFPNLPAVLSTSEPVNVQALDADQNTIVGDAYADANGNPVTISLGVTGSGVTGSGTPNFTMTPTSLSSPSPNGVSLNYNSANLTGPQFSNGFSISLTASASNGATVALSPTVTVLPGVVLNTIANTPDGGPRGITVGPDHNIWFTYSGPGSSVIGTTTLNGSSTDFNTPTSLAGPLGIATGSDGQLWFTESAVNQIGAFNPSNSTFTEFSSVGTIPTSIVAGPDSNLWFTLCGSNQIGTVATTSTVPTTYTIPTSNSEPTGIVVGPDHNLWFTEAAGNKVGRITTTGSISEYLIPTAGAAPGDIVVGSDGAMWFAETGAETIGRITTAGAITELALPPKLQGTAALALGSDGNIWMSVVNAFGRITPAGTTTTFLDLVKPTIGSLTQGTDGNVYFTDATGGSGNSIGEIVL